MEARYAGNSWSAFNSSPDLYPHDSLLMMWKRHGQASKFVESTKLFRSSETRDKVEFKIQSEFKRSRKMKTEISRMNEK